MILKIKSAKRKGEKNDHQNKFEWVEPQVMSTPQG